MASIRKIEGKGGVSYKITVSMGRDAHDKQIRHYKTWKPERPMTARQMEKAGAICPKHEKSGKGNRAGSGCRGKLLYRRRIV